MSKSTRTTNQTNPESDKRTIAQLRTDLAAANGSWGELHRLHLGELRQIAELELKLKASEADLAAAEEQILDGKRLANTYMDELAKVDKENKRCKDALEEIRNKVSSEILRIPPNIFGSIYNIADQALNPKEKLK